MHHSHIPYTLAIPQAHDASWGGRVVRQIAASLVVVPPRSGLCCYRFPPSFLRLQLIPFTLRFWSYYHGCYSDSREVRPIGPEHCPIPGDESPSRAVQARTGGRKVSPQVRVRPSSDPPSKGDGLSGVQRWKRYFLSSGSNTSSINV